MAAIKYDVTDVPEGGGGAQPQPGLYAGKIVEVKERKKKADGSPTHDLEVVISCGEGFAHQWSYIGFSEQTRWKLREFTDAVGLPPKGEIVPSKLKNKPVIVKISADTDQDGDYRGKVKNLFKPGSVDEDQLAKPSENGASADGGATDYTDWSDEDLKAELSEKDITVTGRWTRDKAIEALEEYDGPGANEPEETEETEETSEPSADAPEIPEELAPDLHDDEDEYAGWPDGDIKSYVDDLREAGVDIPIEGRYSKAKAITALSTLSRLYHGTAEAEETGDGDGDGGDDAPTTDEFDEFTDEELQDEINARNEQGAGIKVTGRKTREKMIEALRKDDKPF